MLPTLLWDGLDQCLSFFCSLGLIIILIIQDQYKLLAYIVRQEHLQAQSIDYTNLGSDN